MTPFTQMREVAPPIEKMPPLFAKMDTSMDVSFGRELEAWNECIPNKKNFRPVDILTSISKNYEFIDDDQLLEFYLDYSMI